MEAISTLQTYSENLVRDVMLQLIDAVRYMHHRGVVHRDIRTDIIMVKNLNIKDRIVVKIIDIGFAMLQTPTSSNSTQFMFGTPGKSGNNVLK